MFGHPMQVSYGQIGLVLDVITEKSLPKLAKNLSRHEVARWTNMRHSKTEGQEKEWLERAGTSDTDIYWGIYVCDANTQKLHELVGITGLHKMNPVSMSCVSGIVIFDTAWWGKGVASRAHLARTFYAGTVANRYTIQSAVREPNIASLKALLRVGYIVTGKILRENPGEPGEGFIDTYTMCWLNPYYLSITSPRGLTDEESVGVERAIDALTKAKEVVKFI